MNIIVGTAGHIDHGKTALVKALTGIDADRLPEEKARGITIDIGFAELDLGDGARAGFVDVPGHEKFIKNMLAGAHGIDAVALVVAADAGVMPQTHEHFEICRLLGVKSGVVVLTKIDLVDDAELLELVKLDVAELVENSFLERAPVVPVSTKTRAGLEELKKALHEIARKIPARKNDFVARLPVDRSFSVKGFGAVATGTLISGEISAGDEIEILPGRKRARVRGVQTHGRAVEAARAGQRAAINLGGVELADIERGMVLTEPNVLRPTQIFDAQIEVLKSAKRSVRTRQRVRVHIGTIEALARVRVLNSAGEIAAGETDFAQIRLEIPVAAMPGERFIIRSYSPQATIAGGAVLDNAAQKHRRKDVEAARAVLQNITEADKTGRVKIYLETAGERGAAFSDLQARTGWRAEILQKALTKNVGNKSVVQADKFYVARGAFENLKAKTLAEIENRHKREPLARGISRETLREKIFAHIAPEIFKLTLQILERENKIATEKDFVRLAAHNLELSSEEKTLRDRIEKIYRDARLEVPPLENALTDAAKNTKLKPEAARKVFQLFLNSGEIVKISEEFYFTREAIDGLIKNMKEFAAKTADRSIDVAAFKTIAGVSRKYAIPLLEFFDRERVTRRAGDKRLIL